MISLVRRVCRLDCLACMEVGAVAGCNGACAGTTSVHSTSRRSNTILASGSVGGPVALVVGGGKSVISVL